MPADRSSPILAVVTDPDHARPLALRDCPGLLERLAMLPDPRDRRGRRHTLASVLAVSAAEVAAGAAVSRVMHLSRRALQGCMK